MYVAHFRALFKLHPTEFGLNTPVQNDGALNCLITLIVDHSDAQRKAIYRAMGLILLEAEGKTTNKTGMDKDLFTKDLHIHADEIGTAALEKFLKGCDFHFEQSLSAQGYVQCTFCTS